MTGRSAVRGVWIAFLGVVVFAVGLVSPASAQVRIAAVVNQDVITVQELVERIDFVIATSGLERDNATRQRLLPQVLRSYIDETLQLQEARRLGIRIDEREIDQAFADIARRNGMTVEQLRAFFAERGVKLDTMRRQIRAQLAWARVVKQVLEPRVTVSREQIDVALDQRGGTEEEVRLSEILLPVYAPEQQGQVMAEARELLEAVRDGADFAALAQQVSAAASSDQGGDLGWVRLSDLSPAVRDVVERLEPGVPSDPVLTPDGVRILLVRDRRKAGVEDASAIELAQVVVPLSIDPDPAAEAAALRQAEAVRPRFTSCAAAETLATELRAPASGRLGWMRLEQLPPEFARVVARLPEGQVSEPLRGPLGIHLLFVCRRGGVEGARALARLTLEQAQLERLASRYLRDLRKSAFVDIRL